jgi:hypothetical protein
MESVLLEAIQRENAMTKNWDCNLMFKEEEDGPEIDLLDYINLLEQEEDKIPKNTSYTNFCLYKFTDRFNGLGDWPKPKKELHLSGISGGCSLISNHVKSLDVGKKYHVTYHFDSCTSCQAEHENRSLKAPSRTKPHQNIH